MIYSKVYATQTIWEEKNYFSGALYDEDGLVIQNSLRVSSHAALKHLPITKINISDESNSPNFFENQKYCYCGHFHTHFGHFLFETLASLHMNFWIAEDVKFLFHPFHKDQKDWRQIPFVLDAFLLLGIDIERVEVIKEDTVYSNVMILPRPVVINHYIKKECISVYRSIRNAVDINKDNNPKKLYLSRSKLPADTRAMGIEKELDQLFMKMGFFVIHPEELSFVDQICLVKGADYLAGQEGSALHLSLFMRKNSKVISLTSRQHINIKICNDLAEIDTEIISINNEINSEQLLSYVNKSLLEIMR